MAATTKARKSSAKRSPAGNARGGGQNQGLSQSHMRALNRFQTTTQNAYNTLQKSLGITGQSQQGQQGQRSQARAGGRGARQTTA